MTTKGELRALVDAIPEAGLDDARRALEARADPFLLALARAPIDDEPRTAQDLQAIARGREAFRGGETIDHDEALRQLGLDQSAGGSPGPRAHSAY